MSRQHKLMEEIRDLMKILVEQKRTDEDRAIAQADAIRATTIHEFGHLVHLDMSAGSNPQFLQIDKLVLERFSAPDREELTRYSRTNHKEYFAEAHATYYLDRPWLKKNAPKAFEMVEKALKVRGIL